MAEVEAYLRLAPIRVITIAPEIAGHDALIRALSERGVRMQIGHTLGSYEEGVAAPPPAPPASRICITP